MPLTTDTIKIRVEPSECPKCKNIVATTILLDIPGLTDSLTEIVAEEDPNANSKS